MPKYTLMYFPGRGRAEIVRLIFAQAGVEYEDKRIPGTDWPKHKPDTPWGQMPVLEVDGKRIGQSLAIARYVAREHGLAGKTPQEQALADSVVDSLSDLQTSAIKMRFEKDEAKKAELAKKFQEEELPNMMTKLEKFLGSNEYLVGKNLTWADLFFFNLLDNLTKQNPTCLSSFGKLDALYKKIGALPNIKKWVETRPKTDF